MACDQPLRIGIWCAVSSKAQAADDKISLDEQERLGREFAAAIGGQVVATYCVPGHSRKIIRWSEAEAAMAAYRDLRADMEGGRLDVLWGYDTDRLGRTSSLISQVIEMVEDEGGGEVYLHTAPHMLGSKSVGQRYLTAMQSVRTVEDMKRRAENHHMGMKGRVQRGMMANHPPTGYDRVRDAVNGKVSSYQFNDDIVGVDLMTRLFLQGHSYCEIMRRMNASPYRAPGGGLWRYHVIYAILWNDTYAGLPGWGPYKADVPSPYMPALWDGPTFAAVVQERRRRNRQPYVRKGAGPLTGVAYCNRCGGPMKLQRKRYKDRVYIYLECARHRRKSTSGVSCHNNSTPQHRVLDALRVFFSELANPEVLDRILDQVAAGDDRSQLHQDLQSAQALAADLRRQRERLASALGAGKMDVDIYYHTDGNLRSRLESAEEEIVDLERALESVPDLDQRRGILEDLSASNDLVAQTEPAEISTLLQQAGIRVYIEESQVRRITVS